MRLRPPIFALLAFPVFASANPHLTAAVSDFDNDLRPDFATAAEHDGQYQVQISLTSSPCEGFEFAAAEGGVNLDPQDVDGDNDVDLVISTALGERVGIWLNNGHGHFSQSLISYADRVWHPHQDFRAAQSITSTEELLPGRDHLDRPHRLGDNARTIESRGLAPRPAETVPQFLIAAAHSIRPPPAN